MELDKIGEVKDTLGAGAANELLGKGWILLDMKVVQLGNTERGLTAKAFYILGKKRS